MVPNAPRAVLLTPAAMAEADRLTIAAGISGWTLMHRAAQALVAALTAAYPNARRIAILAGPGNNGGDAFAAATILKAGGCDVAVFAMREAADLSRDAAVAARGFDGPVQPIGAFDGVGFDLIIDGLFGAGLSRPVEGDAAAAIENTTASGLPVVAIDLPSGVSGLTGAVLGLAVSADLTVTFFRRKPGHLLQPGRSRCGRVVVADIGIGAGVFETIAPRIFANGPDLWGCCFPRPSAIGHKFDRGHVVVFSGPATKTGAARLSAMAALRVGAGLVTMASPPSALLINAAHLTAVMVRRCSVPDDLEDLLSDARLGTFVLGPGFGIGDGARSAAQAVLSAGRSLVLDADGITAFASEPDTLFRAIRIHRGEAVLTPHAGEFARLFPDLAADTGLSKLDRAILAAERSGAVVVLKGSDTVVAAPDRRASINESGTAYLATAGSGDVLSGVIAGLRSQSMLSFEAACAGVWMHGRAAELCGPGLIAEDLPALVPRVLAELMQR